MPACAATAALVLTMLAPQPASQEGGISAFTMADQSASERALQRRRALSRWENEGGAICKPQTTSDDQGAPAPMLSPAELSRLRARVVALENVVIALLAGARAEQQDLVQEMAGYLSAAEMQAAPDDGETAAEMLSLLDRSREFCSA